MKNKTHFISSALLIIVILSACKKTSTTNPTTENVFVSKLNGYVQKGPFIIGSSITLYDLKDDLSATGKSFNTQTIDNRGSFKFNNITLSSSYASIKADGYYFNEANNSTSGAPITLYALSQVGDSININVNLLTHLEKSRVEYLIGHGISFAQAKRQAQREIVTIFKMNRADIPNSEDLTIEGGREGNAILLAISTIFQGGLGYNGLEGRVSELLANFASDIEEDGILNNNSLMQKLLDNSVLLDSAAIRNGIITKYSQLGQLITVSDFGKYIDSFVSKTSSELYGSEIYYPHNVSFPMQQLEESYNLLKLNDTIYHRTYFEMVAYLGRNSSLIVKIKDLDAVPTPNKDNSYAYFAENGTAIIPTVENGFYTYTIPIPHHVFSDFQANHHFLIEYYENGSVSPTRQKTIKIIQ